MLNKVFNRVFNVIDFPKTGQKWGEFKALFPGQAAHKVLTKLGKLVNLKNNEDKKFMVFTIEDSQSKKQYTYIGTRVVLINPTIKIINGKEVKFYYKNIVATYKGIFN